LRCSGTVDTPEYLEARGAAEISTEPLACKNLRCVVGCCSLLAQRWLLLFLDACRRCRPRLLVSALLEGKAWTREPSSLFHGPCHVAAEVTPYFTYLSPPPPATLLRSQNGVRWVVQQREMVCGNLSEGSRVCISHAESAFAFCGPLLEPESHRLFDFGMPPAAASR
jgi:hypothetical protein